MDDLENLCWDVISELISLGVIDKNLSLDNLGELTLAISKTIRNRRMK